MQAASAPNHVRLLNKQRKKSLFVWRLVCLESGLFGVWFVWSLVCLETGLFGVWFVWRLVCLETGLFGDWFVCLFYLYTDVGPMAHAASVVPQAPQFTDTKQKQNSLTIYPPISI